jgi:hypothetical protein
MQLSVPSDGSVDVILRFKKPDGTLGGHPAVIAKAVGRGRVVQFAASADTAWWSFPTYANFVPFLDQLLNYELSGGSDRFTLLVGQSLDLSPDAATPGRWSAPKNTAINVVRRQKEVGATQPAATAPATSASGEAPMVDRLIRDPDKSLQAAGFYGPEGLPPTVAVNVDGAEADIKHVSRGQFAAVLGMKEADVMAEPSSLGESFVIAVEPTGIGALARKLLWASLIVFTLEALFARLFSVYR